MLWVLAFNHAEAQNRFTRYPWEAYIGLGPVVFQGDIPSGTFVSDKSYEDYSLSTSNLVLNTGIGYRFAPFWSWRSHLAFIQFAGSDRFDPDGLKNERNISFRTHMLEWTNLLEFSFIHWDIQRKNHHHHAYVATGASLFYFNPQAEYQGEYHNLRPLGTEGQGLNGRDFYPLFGAALPMVVGYRFRISKQQVIGFEISLRKSFSDYLDDVSGSYFDNDRIREERGEMAAYLANPSLGENPAALGSPRGNSMANDNYSYFLIQWSFFPESIKR